MAVRHKLTAIMLGCASIGAVDVAVRAGWPRLAMACLGGALVCLWLLYHSEEV